MFSYQKLSTLMYDLTKPTEPKEEMEFYLRYAEQSQGPILEPMCGSGRFLCGLAKRGYDVTGIDQSVPMLEACRAKLGKEGLKAELLEKKLEDIPELGRRFGLVIVPAGSFGLIEPAAVPQVLQSFFKALLPGGKVVLDVEKILEEKSFDWPWGGKWIDTPQGDVLMINWIGRYDHTQRLIYDMHRYELIRSGAIVETEVETMNRRLYGEDEFLALLSQAGFVRGKRLDTSSFRSGEEAQGNMVFEATRP
jgi:SAM-dependent methyltransferase